MSRTLLVDGDIEVYKIAFACQEPLEWESGYVTPVADLVKARQMVDVWLGELQGRLGADRVRVALSFSGGNWRRAVLPSYKHHRGSAARPLLYRALREYLVEVYGAKVQPDLEADDVLGIWATEARGGERVVASDDKDLRQVPGLLYDPGHADRGIVPIGRLEADLFHLRQALTGDQVDGYGGCPGAGPKRADKVFAGVTTVADGWSAVVAEYEKAGLTAADALVQARVARILRAGEYAWKRKRVRYWEPPSCSPI